VTGVLATHSNREDGMSDDAAVRIRAKENGPYLVTGPVFLTDADGTEYDVSGKATIALCRCGGSTTKPFCDGTHSRTGFQAAERAVAEEEAG
jgi:CDGSH-type Zn-finger protein